MDFNTYQERASSFDIGALDQDNAYIVHVLGLAGETGEVMELIKKAFRDGVKDKEEFKSKLKKELGDILWYLAIVADEHAIPFDEIATHNIEKLQSRKDRGVLGGSGDNR